MDRIVISRRGLLAAGVQVTGALALGTGVAQAQQAWPDRPIRLVHPYAGGGPGDMLTRELAQALQAEFGVGAIADNKPGGGTVIGSEFVAHSAPDGYTALMLGPATHVIMPAVHPKLPYNPDKDFELVGMWAIVGNMISVHPSVPVSNLRELIDYAKANPGRLNYSSAGVGTGPHLAGELFKTMAGVNITHVPYKGAAPAVLGLLGNEVQMTTVNIPPQVPHAKAGKIKPIVVMTQNRSPLVPDVPTSAEAGFPDLIVESWYGVAVPTGTPAIARDRIRQVMFKAGNEPERKARMAAAGIDVKLLNAAQLADYIRAEQRRIVPVLKKLDIKVE